MKKLTNKIISYSAKIKKGKKYKNNIFYCKNSAEGEHKTVKHIRNSDNDYKYVVYGLDADLIFYLYQQIKIIFI